MKKIFTVVNCVVVIIAFFAGGLISGYEDRYGVLTVVEPDKIEMEKIETNHDKNTDGIININTAAKKELESLNGIGPALAERIINYREVNGEFKQIQDIMKVSGISKTCFETIKDNICV